MPPVAPGLIFRGRRVVLQEALPEMGFCRLKVIPPAGAFEYGFEKSMLSVKLGVVTSLIHPCHKLVHVVVLQRFRVLHSK